MKNKKNAKKSQITILLLIGVVIVALVFFFIYIATTTTKRQAQLDIEKGQQIKASVSQINDFVQQCLDKTAKEGLVVLGKQGGRIFKIQGGLEQLDPNNPSQQNAYFKTTPNDPGCRYEKDGKIIETCYVPYGLWVGYDDIKYNDAQEPVIQSFRIRKLDVGYSITSEKYLESYIKERIQSCLNFAPFEKQGFKVGIENKDAIVTISDKDVNVRVVMPTNIENTVTKDKAKFQEYIVKIKIRLPFLHRIAKELVSKDLSKGFDITNDAYVTDENTGLKKEDIQVSKTVSSAGQDEIITITDWKFGINGIPYRFEFARKNRRPQFELPLPSINACHEEVKQPNSVKVVRITSGDPVVFDLDEEDVPLPATKSITPSEKIDLEKDKNIEATVTFTVFDGSKYNIQKTSRIINYDEVQQC